MLMIANSNLFCYSYSMRKVASICGVIVGVVIAGYIAREELFSFIVIGKVPFTGIIIPSTVMVVFWIGIVPAYILFANSIKKLFWSLISVIGEKHQQSLNRRYRILQRHTQANSMEQSPSLAMVATWINVTDRTLAQQDADDTQNKASSNQLAAAPTA